MGEAGLQSPVLVQLYSVSPLTWKPSLQEAVAVERKLLSSLL